MKTDLGIFNKGESLTDIDIDRIPTNDLGRNHKDIETVCTHIF